MSENNPESLPTSIRAGPPSAPDRPSAAGAEPRDDDGGSMLARFGAAIKPYERWGLLCGVALQLLVLVSMMAMGMMIMR